MIRKNEKGKIEMLLDDTEIIDILDYLERVSRYINSSDVNDDDDGTKYYAFLTAKNDFYHVVEKFHRAKGFMDDEKNLGCVECKRMLVVPEATKKEGYVCGFCHPSHV